MPATSDIKTLITAIRKELRDELSALVRAVNIDVLPDLDIPIFPHTATFPFVGISDGDIDHGPEYQSGEERVLNVDIAVYVQIFKGVDAVMGDDGVLALEAEIMAVLNNNDLDQTGVFHAVITRRWASKTLFSETDMAQMKKLRMTYQRLSDY